MSVSWVGPRGKLQLSPTETLSQTVRWLNHNGNHAEMIRTKTQALRILILFLMLGILAREIWQVVTVKMTVDNVARQLSRYVATMQYDPELFKAANVQ